MLPHHQRRNADPAPCSGNFLGQPESCAASSPTSSTSLPVNDQVSWKSDHKFAAQIVTRDPQELRPHPSYARHGLTVPADALSALRQRRELAFVEPLMTTRDGIIIDGYARWQLAKESRRPFLNCIEYELSEAEALELLLQKHRRSTGLNDYSRIILALDLEPELTEKAHSNRQFGGQHKGWSNLTKAEQVHVRSEIANAAGVSTGNVTKVKQLYAACVNELKEALSNDEISIHWAWKLRNNNLEDQVDALARLRFERGLKTEIRQLASRRRRRIATPQNANDLISRLSDLEAERLEAVSVIVLKGHEPTIFITEGLARITGLEQSRLWNQNAS
jgi:hypothetical protein